MQTMINTFIMLLLSSFSSLWSANPGPLKLVTKNDIYYINNFIPAWGEESKKEENIPATILDTTNNTVGLSEDDVCGYGQFGSDKQTMFSADTSKNVVVCQYGSIFKDVVTIEVPESQAAHLTYENYIGQRKNSSARLGVKKVIYLSRQHIKYKKSSKN
jgi:hypothetical protein